MAVRWSGRILDATRHPVRGAGLGRMGRERGNAHAVRCAGKGCEWIKGFTLRKTARIFLSRIKSIWQCLRAGGCRCRRWLRCGTGIVRPVPPSRT